jgi:hypothetical protein
MILEDIIKIFKILFIIDSNGSNQWPEVLTFLFELSSSTNIVLKECALNIFTYVVDAC